MAKRLVPSEEFCGIFFTHRMANTAPGLLVMDEIHFFQRVEKHSSPGVGRAHWETFKLGLKGEGNETRLSRDEVGAVCKG